MTILKMCFICPNLSTSIIITVLSCHPCRNWLKGEWREQALDKDFIPVDPTFTHSRSLQSVIEPLQIENRQGFDTSVCASTSDNFESETVSSSCSNEKELREHDETTCTSCISDRERTLSNISTEKFHCFKSTVFEPCTCQTLPASVFHVEGKREERYTLKGW